MACRITGTSVLQPQEVKVLRIQHLSNTSSPSGGLEIVDWTQTGNVPVNVKQASSQVTLSPSKTYLLVGMTGDLEQSVCE